MPLPARKAERLDDGLFGPDSVCWEVVGHPVNILGEYRNLFYSVLSPEVSQAVADHSVFFDQFERRARETAYWVYTTVYGDTAQARQAGKFVNGKHAKVKGHDPITNSEYHPYRPDLAIAAFCLIWESHLAAYEAYVRTLTDQERERYWAEGLRAAEPLNVDPSTFPQTWAEWREHYDTEITPRLALGVPGNDGLHAVRRAFFAPRWLRLPARALVAFVDELTLATMPREARSLVGGYRSKQQVALAKRVGRPVVAVLTIPAVRDVYERSVFGREIHELLAEARHIKAAANAGKPVRYPMRREAETDMALAS